MTPLAALEHSAPTSGSRDSPVKTGHSFVFLFCFPPPLLWNTGDVVKLELGTLFQGKGMTSSLTVTLGHARNRTWGFLGLGWVLQTLPVGIRQDVDGPSVKSRPLVGFPNRLHNICVSFLPGPWIR